MDLFDPTVLFKVYDVYVIGELYYYKMELDKNPTPFQVTLRSFKL